MVAVVFRFSANSWMLKFLFMLIFLSLVK